MRRIVNSTFISLDGVTERLEKWHFAYHDDSAIRYAMQQLAEADAVLMGRATYESYAGVWPAQEGAYAERINGIRKYVASTTLGEPGWQNTTVLDGELVAAVGALKREPGRDILMHGFGPVARTLLQHGLLDEVHLWVHPVIVGEAEPTDLFFRDGMNATLTPSGVTALDSGVVVLSYATQSIVNGS